MRFWRTFISVTTLTAVGRWRLLYNIKPSACSCLILSPFSGPPQLLACSIRRLLAWVAGEDFATLPLSSVRAKARVFNRADIRDGGTRTLYPLLWPSYRRVGDSTYPHHHFDLAKAFDTKPTPNPSCEYRVMGMLCP